MEFNSFTWISEAISFSLQAYCVYLFRGRKSLQLLMLVLCFRNILAVATHTMPWPYYYQLYFGRIITSLLALWACGDVACYPATPKWTLRLPVAFAALLAIPYWPMNPNNGPAEMEEYRMFCLLGGFVIVGLHFAFLTAARRIATLQLLLLIALAVEMGGILVMLRIGYHPRVQMFYWWIALVVLGSIQRVCNFGQGNGSLLSDPSVPAGDRRPSTSATIDIGLRVPLHSRFPHSRVFERWSD